MTVCDVGVGSEKHQNSPFNCLVQSEHKFAQVFVALVKVLIVEVELEFVALKVTVENSCEHLALLDEMLANKLHFKVRV